MGEHLLCTQGVVGSNPSSSTTFQSLVCCVPQVISCGVDRAAVERPVAQVVRAHA